MVIGLVQLVLRLVRRLVYLVRGRTEWLVVVQDYTARAADPEGVAPKECVAAPTGGLYLVRSVPGWSGENPRYRWTQRMRDHIFPAELSGIIPGYVEVLPDRPTATARAAEITADVRGGRWPWTP